MDDRLNRAVAAAKAGRKEEAQELLLEILRQDQSNEAAWLWLSGVVDTVDERIACLENVLEINPTNAAARRGLTSLNAAAPPQAQAPAARTPRPESAPGFAPRPTLPSSAPAWPVVATETVSQAQPAASPVREPAAASRNLSAFQSARPVPTLTLAQPGTKMPDSTTDLILKGIVGLLIAGIVAIAVYFIASQGAVSGLSSSSEPSKNDDGWQSFTPAKGAFTVSVPGDPDYEITPVNTPAGVVDLHTYAVEKRYYAYIVAFGDYPPGLVQGANIELMLDGARDGAVANVGGKLVHERRMRLLSYPGREIEIEVEMDGREGIALARMYLVGNRLYQILVAGTEEHFESSQPHRFLDSFRLLVR